jgi:hypothetical protein
MNTPLITQPAEEAREQLRAVRRSLHRRADAEYEALAAGLAEQAAGRSLLNLRDCFLGCPVDAVGRPRLAIARADRKQVHFGLTAPRAATSIRAGPIPRSGAYGTAIRRSSATWSSCRIRIVGTASRSCR